MKRAVLIALLLLAIHAGLFGQASKRKQSLKKNAAQQSVSPCGVPIPRYDDWLEERKTEWRIVTESPTETHFYNTRKMLCDKNGILKVWGKSIEKDTTKNLSYQIVRYELKCRSNQIKIVSGTDYDKSGKVLKLRTYDDPTWEDAIPDSIGEAILETICHK